ncbi:DUF4421 family protein [Flavobacterium saccharophilum]|uniref:DUF4421 domain-containing protein n=1 Tax=Flavobacterium saccharophilum TaxID=29534 RepID=A0A1M7AWK6_9FLAO|nr:DUF4421 family protein [Flavobacterium saccharophilum]SHL46799.1 protein of unknown function [Flavobacterium saccharophilum]
MKTATKQSTNQNNKYTLICVFLVTFFLNFSSLYSQNEKSQDTANFIYYPDKIMIRTNLSTQSDNYLLNNKKGANLDLETNNSYKLFLSVDYKFIGFSYGFYPKFFGGNKDEDLKGKSTFSDYNFRFFLGRWLQTVNYSKTKGYYVANMKDFAPDWVEGKDPYLQFPDFKTLQLGMSTSYIFNPKFSLKSITTFTEWQKKSAGSFVPSLIYSYNTIRSKSDDIDGKQKEFDLRLAAGYYYNFIINKRFYVASHLSPSLGVKFMKDKSIDSGVETIEKDTYFTRNLDGGLKMGYNSDRILFGASLNFSVSSYNQDKSTVISNDKIFGLLYFGYRFDAPGFIAKPVEKIDDKIKM